MKGRERDRETRKKKRRQKLTPVPSPSIWPPIIVGFSSLLWDCMGDGCGIVWESSPRNETSRGCFDIFCWVGTFEVKYHFNEVYFKGCPINLDYWLSITILTQLIDTLGASSNNLSESEERRWWPNLWEIIRGNCPPCHRSSSDWLSRRIRRSDWHVDTRGVRCFN